MTAVTSDGEVVVRPMRDEDVAPVVRLQLSFLEGSFITELGARFLMAFHRAALDHAQTKAFVAFDEGKHLAGFVMATIDVHAFNAHVKRRIVVPMATALASPRRTRIALRIALSLFEGEPQPPIPAELLLLVVSGTARRRGHGQRLLTTLEAAFRAEGIARYRVAVRSHLAVARLFYVAAGFDFEEERRVLGAPMTYLTKLVSEPSKPTANST
jgi:ribosomal protein S18 acetylase RimI-like enzyme